MSSPVDSNKGSLLPNSVLIIGRGLYACQLLRIFHNAKVPKIFLATTSYLDFARVSFACTKSFVIVKPDSNRLDTVNEYSNAIQGIVYEYKVDFIVPVAEESLFVSYLADSWFANGLKAKILAIKFSLMDELHDKYRFQKLCEQVPAEFCVPRTEKVESVGKLIQVAEKMVKDVKCEKLVIKPVYTRGGRSLWILPPPPNSGYENLVSFISPSRPHVVQEFVPGKEFSSLTVFAKGKILSHVCYKAEFPIKGFFTVRTSMRKPAILNWVNRFAHFLDSDFSGILGFDFIETFSGDICALECNPRFTNGISFFACDPSLCRGFSESLYAAANCRNNDREKQNLPLVDTSYRILDKSTIICDVGDDVLEPRLDFTIATMLPALSLLRSSPGLFRVLLSSHADMEWPSDPLPLFMTFVKVINLLRTSIPKLLFRGESLTDLAAKATEDELVKYNDCLMVREQHLYQNPELQPPPQHPYANQTILVTGASGFLGSRLVLKLVEDGCCVIATGRNRVQFEDVLRNAGKTLSKNLSFVPCDLNDRSAIKVLVRHVNVVIHCAAKCSPWGLEEDFMRDNVEVVRFLLESCASKESACHRFIHVSSPSVAFGIDQANGRMFVKESEPIPKEDKQANMYSKTKMLAERLVQEFSCNFKEKLCICSIRPRAIYGPGDRALFPRIVSRLREERLPQIGDGNTVVDLTHVDNVVHSLILCIQAPSEICHGQVYNITDCSPVRLWDLIYQICEELDFSYPRFSIPHWIAFGIAHVIELGFGLLLGLGISEREPILTRYAVNILAVSQTLDCTKARRHLKYEPIITTEEGISKFLDGIKEAGSYKPKRKNAIYIKFRLMVKPFMQALCFVCFTSVILRVLVPHLYNTFYFLFGLIFTFMGKFSANREFEQDLQQAEAKRRRNVRTVKNFHRENNCNKVTGAMPSSMYKNRPWNLFDDEEERFKQAVKLSPAVSLNSSSAHFLLDLYGLYKQQKDGDCDAPCPSITKPREVAKWKAWNDRKGLPPQQAKSEYCKVMDRAFDLLEQLSDPESDKEFDLEFCKTKEKVLYKVCIEGVGKYLPKRTVSTLQMQELCGVAKNYSEIHNVGVDSRHWADWKQEGETNSFMAAQAIEQACKEAKIQPKDLDLIINASASNERILPDGSCFIKKALGLENSHTSCFSVHATCLSFLVAFDIAASFIQLKRYKKIVIVSSELSSVACNFKQPESALLIGDGAAACIISESPKNSTSCVFQAHFENYCRGVDSATLRCGTLTHPAHIESKPEHFLFDMNGPLIVECVREVGAEFLERVRPGLSSRLPEDISLVVPHQPSGTALDMLLAHGWPSEKTIRILNETGNCVAASIPLALCEAIESGRLQRGMKFLMCGTGGGITLGAMILQY